MRGSVGGHRLAEARLEHPLEVLERGEAAFGANPAQRMVGSYEPLGHGIQLAPRNQLAERDVFDLAETKSANRRDTPRCATTSRAEMPSTACWSMKRRARRTSSAAGGRARVDSRSTTVCPWQMTLRTPRARVRDR